MFFFVKKYTSIYEYISIFFIHTYFFKLRNYEGTLNFRVLKLKNSNSFEVAIL